MSFLEYLSQDSKEDKLDVLMLCLGFAVAGHFTIVGALGGILLILLVEYYTYRT